MPTRLSLASMASMSFFRHGLDGCASCNKSLTEFGGAISAQTRNNSRGRHRGEDVRRVRVQELTFDEVKMACLRIFGERLTPEDEDAFHLEFFQSGRHHPLAPATFSDLVLLHVQQQLEHQQSRCQLPTQKSLRLHVVEHPPAEETYKDAERASLLLQVKTELEDIPAPATPEFWTSQEQISQPQTPETPYPESTPMKEEAEDRDDIKLEPECEACYLATTFQSSMEADRKVNIVSVRKAARQLLKQVRRQREASRREEKKVAKSKRKARRKVLKRMEKAAKLAARRLFSRTREGSNKRSDYKDEEEIEKRSKRRCEPAWRSEAEEEEQEEDEELDEAAPGVPNRQQFELNTKQTRKERKKAAKRLLKFAKTARKLRKKKSQGSLLGEELTGPDKELRKMVRNAQVALEGLFQERDPALASAVV